MGAPQGREQTAGLATEAGRDGNQWLGTPRGGPHRYVILWQSMVRGGDSSMIESLMRIDLIKYQALGNDYLVLDLPGPLDELVEHLPGICDRHRGLGSDGLLAFDPKAMTVQIFNPDRSEAQKSGNGLRIAAAHAVLQHGAGDRFELTTAGGPTPVQGMARNGAEIVSELDIGRPSFRAADLPAKFDGEPDRVRLETPAGTVEAMLVSVGNPHCVVLGEPATMARCLELGPHLERHPAFPGRTNGQLLQAVDQSGGRRG